MEGRDLSPSSSSTVVAAVAAANCDGSLPADADDGVFSVAAALAKDAALHFQSGKYLECVQVLNQLLQKKQNDPKVLHNIAIAEYFQNGCSDPKKLLDVLNGVKTKSDDIARASGEQGANSTSVMYTDEFDSSVVMLNIAIVWFHLHEYAKTISVLEPLYQNIEPIEETTALHICLLLLDSSLACHDASKSADVLTYLERAFGVSSVSQVANGSTAQQQSTNLITKSSSVPSSTSAADSSTSDLGSSATVSEGALSRTLFEETLDYEAMLLDISGQNLARPTAASSSDLSRVRVDGFSTVLKLKLQLYKVRFLLLTRNLKLAKREVKLAMKIAHERDSSITHERDSSIAHERDSSITHERDSSIAHERDSAITLLLKSQLEYARGNHRKAIKLLMESIKLLMTSSNRMDTAFSSIFNNNLGCIYFRLGKYQTSSLFFSKALTNCSSLRKDKPLKLATFSQDNSLLLIYNCGVQYLACGNPILAARCFQKASLIFHKQPLLWLRLSECCLMALQKGLINSKQVSLDRLEVRVHVVGKGKWRHLVLEDHIPRNGHVDSSERDESCPSNDGQLTLSMSLARQCLINALLLMDSCRENCSTSGLPSSPSVDENDSSEVSSSKNSNHKNLHSIDSKAFVGLGQVNSNGDTREQKGGTSQEIIQNSLTYYEDICRRENQLIKEAALANLAYVELESENPVKALSAAKSLLEIPDCSRIYNFLGHVYAAEALCLLNRPREAAEHLSVYLSGGNIVELPFSQEDCEKWRVQRTVDFEEANGGATAAKISSPEDSQNIVFLKLEEARATIYSNFAAMYAIQGDYERAHQLVTQALSIIPNSPEATLTAVYVDLLLGKPQEALDKLKRCSRIRFLPSGITLNKSS